MRAYTEAVLQATAVRALAIAVEQGAAATYAGDAGGMAASSKREARRMVQTGLMAGEPDLRLYLPGGRVVLIEMKRRRGGVVSREQKRRHELLKSLGFEVHIHRHDFPRDAALAVLPFVDPARVLDHEAIADKAVDQTLLRTSGRKKVAQKRAKT